MWHSSPVAEVRAHVARPLVRLGQQHPVLVVRVERRARSSFSTSCVSGRFSQLVPSRSMRYGTASSRIPSTPMSSQKRMTLSTARAHVRVVEVQVGLMVEEAVPVVGAGHRVPGPVRRLGVREDDARALVAAAGVAPDVVVALGRAGRRAARRLEPRVLIGRVVDDELGDHLQAARRARRAGTRGSPRACRRLGCTSS